MTINRPDDRLTKTFANVGYNDLHEIRKNVSYDIQHLRYLDVLVPLSRLSKDEVKELMTLRKKLGSVIKKMTTYQDILIVSWKREYNFALFDVLGFYDRMIEARRAEPFLKHDRKTDEKTDVN